tara:strand:- start:4472 stop:4690 length:219 start_codon:yes stop_codon:yes gene_type:complete
MKDGIQLGTFIEAVKTELLNSKKSVADSYLYLEDIEIEVSFGLDTTGGAKGRLFVLELGGGNYGNPNAQGKT